MHTPSLARLRDEPLGVRRDRAEQLACGAGGTFFHRLPTANMTSPYGQAF
jgi:hypothetical protein